MHKEVNFSNVTIYKEFSFPAKLFMSVYLNASANPGIGIMLNKFELKTTNNLRPKDKFNCLIKNENRIKSKTSVARFIKRITMKLKG